MYQPPTPPFKKSNKHRVRHEPGTMNKTESAYAEFLKIRQLAGEIIGFRFESYKLRLADKTWFTADFMVQLDDGLIELHEVKASDRNGKTLIEDDAAVKLKVAAELYPEFQFVLVVKTKTTWEFQFLR